MQRQAFLHLGSHKTGSSAIQNWLQQNEEALKSADIVFPESGRGRLGNCRKLAEALHAKPDDQNWDDTGFIKQQFNQELLAYPDKDIVISAEYFSRIIVSGEIRVVASRLKRMGFDIRSCLFVRNPIDLINSAFAQRCKMLNETDFSAFRSLFQESRRGNWLLRMQRLEAAGMNPSALLFAKKYRHESLVKRMFDSFSVTGRLPAEVDFTMSRENESFGELGVAVSYIVSAALSDASQTLTMQSRHWLSDLMRQHVAPYDEKKFSSFSPEQSAKRTASLKSNMEEFANQYLEGDAAGLLACETSDQERSPWCLDELQGVLKSQAEDRAAAVFDAAGKDKNYLKFLPTDPFHAL